MRMDNELVERVITLARQAADDILAVYHSDFAVQSKDDRSPLTAADMAAHHRISAGLRQIAPDIPVLSEESDADDIADRRQWQRLWLVDPLDGTREFIKRNGEFTINIALIEHGEPVFGLIQQPVTGLLWHATRGAAAFRREGGLQTRIHAQPYRGQPVRVAASRSHRDAQTQALLAALPDCEIVGCGSSLKFCRIAEGQMDLYPRFGPTSEWDTAAGQVILEAAGGVVWDRQGRAFRYNQRAELLNGDFVALADAALFSRLPL